MLGQGREMILALIDYNILVGCDKTSQQTVKWQFRVWLNRSLGCVVTW